MAEVVDAGRFKLVARKRTKRACHGKEGYASDFFYVYYTIFCDIFIRLPFSNFDMGVLWELNMVPTQLHSNGWTLM